MTQPVVATRLSADLAAGITAGFTHDAAAWAVQSLEDVVIPSWADAPGIKITDIEDSLRSLSAMDPDTRWHAIIDTHYRVLLEPMRDQAHRLAERSAAGGEFAEWVEVEAGLLLAFVEALADEMRAASPDTFDELLPELNDTVSLCMRLRSPPN